MSPWPGTPKSQQTPPINPPSVRFPFTLNEDSSQEDVHDAIRTALNGLTVHEQAFANIPAQVAAQASAAATAAVENISSEVVAGVTSFNARTGPVIYFPGLGTVNNQLGESSYATEQGDAGAKILVGDSGPVTVTLSSDVTLPWFTIIGNDSGASVLLMPDSGALHGLSTLKPGGLAFVFYDGNTFWSEGIAGAAATSDSGMTGFIPKWTSPESLGDSHLDDGVTVAGQITSSEPFSAQAHSAFGVGSTVDNFPPTAPDGGGGLSPKAIIVVEETSTGDLENGSYVGLTLNPASPPATASAIGSLVEVIAEGSNIGGTALFGGWVASVSKVNSPDSAPALGGSVSGAYVNGTAEIPFATGFTADFVNFSTATIDYGSGIQIFLGQTAAGHIDAADGLAVAYNAGSGSTADLLNYLHMESPNNGGDAVTVLVGLQIDALEAVGVGTAIPIKSDSVSPSIFAGPISTPYLQTPTVYSAAGTPLPSAATAGVGARAFVSDATAAAFAAPYVSGGAHKVPVYSDGANWFVG